MQKIIDEIEASLKAEGEFVENLRANSKLYWQEDYLVAVVHERVRVKDATILEQMEKREFFDAEGKSAHNYTEDDVQFLKSEVKPYLKTISILGKEKREEEGYLFQEKYDHDYWKKIENRSGFRVMIERSFYEHETLCEIESNLRDVMRSSKEVPSIKVIGFVWIAKVPASTDLERVMSHYFLENHRLIEKADVKFYIGWSPTLKEVNMRYFVCPPS
jgi:hypothetical protein